MRIRIRIRIRNPDVGTYFLSAFSSFLGGFGEGVNKSFLSFVIPPPVFGMGGVEVSPVVAVIPVVRSERFSGRYWEGGRGGVGGVLKSSVWGGGRLGKKGGEVRICRIERKTLSLHLFCWIWLQPHHSRQLESGILKRFQQ